MIKIWENIDINNLKYLSEGGDHIIFSYKSKNEEINKIVFKIKKEKLTHCQITNFTLFKNDIKMYKVINNYLFNLMKTLEFDRIFPDIQNEKKISSKKLDLKKLNENLKKLNKKVSLTSKTVLISKNLFLKKNESKYKTIFLEFKPKNWSKVKITKEILDSFDFENIDKDYLLNEKKNLSKLMFSKFEKRDYCIYNIHERKYFMKCCKKFLDMKNFKFKKIENDIIKSVSIKDTGDYFDIDKTKLCILLTKIFFYDFNYKNGKINIPQILEGFYNLYPFLFLCLKKNISLLKKTNFNSVDFKEIFDKIQNDFFKKKKFDLKFQNLENPIYLLECMIRALMTATISDCSLIFKINKFESEIELDLFLKQKKEFKEIIMFGEFYAFKVNIIDTELKRFKKIFSYFNVEKKILT